MWGKKGGWLFCVCVVFCMIQYICMRLNMNQKEYVYMYIYTITYYGLFFLMNDAYTPQGLTETSQCRTGRDGYIYTHTTLENPHDREFRIYVIFFHVFPLLKWDAGMAKVLGPRRFCCISSGMVGIYCWWRF